MNPNAVADESIPVPASPGRSGAREFLQNLDELLDGGTRNVVLDCRQLNRVTSQDIRVLWLARERCGESGADFQLANVGSGLRRVLEALDLTEVFLPAESEGSRQPLAMEIRTNESDVDKAMAQLVSYLLQRGVPELTAFEVQTVFYEVATNIRRHGGLGESGTMDFTADVSDKAVVLTFVDTGRRFDPTARDTANRLPTRRRAKAEKRLRPGDDSAADKRHDL